MGHSKRVHVRPHRVRLAVTMVCLMALGRAPAARAAAAPSAAEQMAVATTELGYFNFDKSAELFAAVRAASERGSLQWQQATLGQAVAVQQGTPATPERVAEATALYNDLLAAAPTSPSAARATMNLGRLAELSDYYQDPIDLPAARDWYRKVVDGWPTDPIAGEATLRLAAAFVQTYQPDDVKQGIRVLEAWLARHPSATEPLASGMYQYLGDTYFFPLNDLRKSLDAYAKADAIGWLDDSDLSKQLWRMAVIADRLGDRDAAVRYYTKVVTDTPTQGKAYVAQLALRRLGAPVPEIKLMRTRQQPSQAVELPKPTTAPTQGAADAR